MYGVPNFCRPSGASNIFLLATHGSRRGLHSAAASGGSLTFILCLLLSSALLPARRLRLAYEAASLVAEGLLEARGPVGLVGVEPLEVFEDAGVAARELLYERGPARRQLLRPLARRVNALGDGRVYVHLRGYSPQLPDQLRKAIDRATTKQ